MAAPKRELFKVAEVCDVVQVQPYVLRSWEAEFPQLGQAGISGGPRQYRRADVELALRIKHLVFDEGLTLAGARRRLEEEGSPTNGASAAMVEEILGDRAKDRVRNVRNGLQSLLQLLSKDGQRELELVPPAPPRRSRKK
ncbi:MAG: MerR family transcriptional regulator [Vicinamibacterales bacterium]